MDEPAAQSEDDHALIRRLQQALGTPPASVDAPSVDTVTSVRGPRRVPPQDRPSEPGAKAALDPAVSVEAIRIAEQILESAGTVARAQARPVDARHTPDGR